MKKIDVEKSTVYGKEISSLKESLDHLKEEGFFSDFEGFTDYKEDILRSVLVAVNAGYPYEGECNGDNYKYFIPKSLAVFEEPEEKKYRPYMYLDELPFNVGDVIRYRCKQCCSECRGIVTGLEYQNNNDGDLDNIIIGGMEVTPQELFDQYELKNDDCEYVPFGIEE